LKSTDKVLTNLIEVAQLEENQASARILGIKLTGDTLRSTLSIHFHFLTFFSVIVGVFVLVMTLVFYTYRSGGMKKTEM
jgi:hypothetical protein